MLSLKRITANVVILVLLDVAATKWGVGIFWVTGIAYFSGAFVYGLLFPEPK